MALLLLLNFHLNNEPLLLSAECIEFHGNYHPSTEHRNEHNKSKLFAVKYPHDLVSILYTYKRG